MENGKSVVALFAKRACDGNVMERVMKMAASWKLPIVFILEKNGENKKETTVEEGLATRAQGYGMEGIVVNGLDVLAVYQAAKKAVRQARNDEGPTLIEYKTDTEKDCFSEVERDPIQQFRSVLLKERTPKAVIDMIEKRVEEAVEIGIGIMEKSAFPSWEQTYKEAYMRMFASLP